MQVGVVDQETGRNVIGGHHSVGTLGVSVKRTTHAHEQVHSGQVDAQQFQVERSIGAQDHAGLRGLLHHEAAGHQHVATQVDGDVTRHRQVGVGSKRVQRVGRICIEDRPVDLLGIRRRGGTVIARGTVEQHLQVVHVQLKVLRQANGAQAVNIGRNAGPAPRVGRRILRRRIGHAGNGQVQVGVVDQETGRNVIGGHHSVGTLGVSVKRTTHAHEQVHIRQVDAQQVQIEQHPVAHQVHIGARRAAYRQSTRDHHVPPQVEGHITLDREQGATRQRVQWICGIRIDSRPVEAGGHDIRAVLAGGGVGQCVQVVDPNIEIVRQARRPQARGAGSESGPATCVTRHWSLQAGHGDGQVGVIDQEAGGVGDVHLIVVGIAGVEHTARAHEQIHIRQVDAHDRQDGPGLARQVHCGRSLGYGEPARNHHVTVHIQDEVAVNSEHGGRGQRIQRVQRTCIDDRPVDSRCRDIPGVLA